MLWLSKAVALMWLVIGCATPPVSSEFSPRSINEIRFRDRSQSKYDDEVRVTVAVPSADETKALFSANLYLREIQLVWVKVENNSDRTYYLLSIPVDPNYFSPLETAYAAHGGLDQSARREMEKYYRRMNFKNPVLPNTAVSGFIFTNLDEGEKIVQVTLIAVERVKIFTFFLEIPGMRVDYKMVDFDSLYPKEEIVELSQSQLWAALEKLSCCTTSEEGTALGDPINLVIIGDFKDIAAAFARRGWLPAEETYSRAIWKMIKSFLFGSRYRYSPVSPLYFFGRHQDFARQKPRHDIHERNHLRLWYSPFRYQGKAVFVGQISRDIGVRFTTKTWPPVTHKIDPDIDEARHSLVEDLVFSQMIAKVGWVKGVGPAIDKLVTDKKYYAKMPIPVQRFYRGLAGPEDEVATFGVVATLCTSSRIPEELVYVLTKTIFENLDEFRRQHPALADLKMEGILKGLTAPLYPGAVKYFNEAGLLR